MSSFDFKITDVMPLNYQEERETFLADQSYNPQFKYAKVTDTETLQAWGLPQEKFFLHAQKFLKAHAANANKIHIDQAYIEEKLEAFSLKNNLPKPLKGHFSLDYPTRCRIEGFNLYFGLPITYSAETFADLCRHELETHLLRKLNNNLQPWKDESIADPLFRRTEEGLANLHTHLFRKHQVLRKSYVSYVSIYLSQTHSFAEVFAQLKEFGLSDNLAFLVALRGKRGLTDTSQPGGLTKDICYFEGAVQVWDWLVNQKNDPHDLYLGRISLDQIPSYKSRAVLAGLRYPSFFEDMDTYLEKVAQIGEVNHFEDLL